MTVPRAEAAAGGGFGGAGAASDPVAAAQARATAAAAAFDALSADVAASAKQLRAEAARAPRGDARVEVYDAYVGAAARVMRLEAPAAVPEGDPAVRFVVSGGERGACVGAVQLRRWLLSCHWLPIFSALSCCTASTHQRNNKHTHKHHQARARVEGLAYEFIAASDLTRSQVVAGRLAAPKAIGAAAKLAAATLRAMRAAAVASAAAAAAAAGGRVRVAPAPGSGEELAARLASALLLAGLLAAATAAAAWASPDVHSALLAGWGAAVAWWREAGAHASQFLSKYI